MIEEFYLILRWDRSKYYESGSEWTGVNGNERVCHFLQSFRFETSPLDEV